MKTITASLLGLSALVAASMAAPARAATELVVNGNFEQTSLATSYQINKNGVTTGTTVTGWSNTGYNFIFTPGTADTTGAYTPEFSGTTRLAGPGTGNANGLTATSPTGGNFVAADGGFEPGALSQAINGLTAGANYLLTFYWAAAQQSGAIYNQATTESFTVGFGSQTRSTATVTTPIQGFTPWRQEAFYFTASAASQVLSFLAAGTPNGQPPFSLLDGVSLVAAPEPATWAVMTIGLVGAGVMMRRRNRRNGPGAATA